jgi:hypothetical protein
MTDVLEHVVPDPVLYCEKLHVCPTLPAGAAHFTEITVDQVRLLTAFTFSSCCCQCAARC